MLSILHQKTHDNALSQMRPLQLHHWPLASTMVEYHSVRTILTKYYFIFLKENKSTDFIRKIMRYTAFIYFIDYKLKVENTVTIIICYNYYLIVKTFNSKIKN